MANQESKGYQDLLEPLTIKKPVFITSLPRSGTTILLNALSETNEFSFHSYQDMPFIFTPLIWAKFRRLLTQNVALQERSHKDGIMIDQYSAEAFEEMLWKEFWPRQYMSSSIATWPNETNDKFATFFFEHIKKLMVRDTQNFTGGNRRYLSKNNLNISRLPYIKTLFPDCLIVIPFRDPLQHAMSLLNQHLNFLTLHQHNAFAKFYMASIGHYDFGANLKPINFNDWFFDTLFNPDSLNFWLEYWIQACQYIIRLDCTSHIFFNLDKLCKSPRSSLGNLAEHLLLEQDGLSSSIPTIKIPRTYDVESHLVKSENVDKSYRLYQQLLSISANG
jgi:hypothetical protein